MTHGIIKAFKSLKCTPIRPRSQGEGSASGLFPDENDVLPTSNAREQWILDELRKVEGQ